MQFLPPDRFVGLLLADVVTPARCRELVGELESRGFAATGQSYPADYRDNDRLVFDEPALAAWLFELTRAQLPAELVIGGERWQLRELNTRFRACRYRGGQGFCIHRDGPHAPSDDARSHLTLQLYLDDVAETAGGRTRFYSDARGTERWAAIAPRCGTAIVFDHRAWHDGEPVTEGVKHVLRTDVMYERVSRIEPVERDGLIGSHRSYTWQAIVCRDGSIASAGRDGTVRRWRSRVEAQAVGEGRSGREADAVGAGRSGPEDHAGGAVGGSGREADAVGAVGGSGGEADAVGAVGRSGGEADAVGRSGPEADAVDAVGRSGRDAVHALGAGSVTALVETTDGRLWCGTRSGRLVVIDDGRVAQIAEDLGAVLCIIERPQNGIVVATSRGTLHAFDDATAPQWTTTVHDGWAWCVTTSGDALISCGTDGAIMRIDRDGHARTIATLDHAARAIVSLSSGELLVGDTRGWMHRFDRGELIASWRAHEATITSIAVRDRLVATASEDGSLRLWRDYREVGAITSTDFVTSVAFDGDGSLVYASYDGSIRRHCAYGERIRTPNKMSISRLV